MSAVLPSRLPPKKRQWGDFDAEEFRQFITELGAVVTWQMASQCPCVRKAQDVASDTGFSSPLSAFQVTQESQIECTACGGRGYVLHSDQDVRAIVQDMRTNGRRFDTAGEYARGSARVTLLPEHKPSLGDRLTVKDSVVLVREDRKRGNSVAESLRFPIVGQTLDLSGGLTIKKTLHVQKANVNNVSTPADVLVEGTDFVVDAQGRMDWTLGVANGKAPAINAFYTVSYYANPRYAVIDMLYGVRDTFVQNKQPLGSGKFQTMPVCVVAQQEWLGGLAGDSVP